MEYLRSILSRCKGRRAERCRPYIVDCSLLSELPLEILFEVLSYLSISSIASFSTSCMHFRHVLGDGHLNQLARQPSERLVFLHLLVRDLPRYSVCDICRKIHRIKNLEDCAKFVRRRSGRSHEVPVCLEEDRWNSVGRGFFKRDPGRTFSSTIFKMVIRHKKDSKFREVLDLMTDDSGIILAYPYIEQRRTTYHVAHGRLIQRLQSVFI